MLFVFHHRPPIGQNLRGRYEFMWLHLHLPGLQMCGLSLNRDMICAGLPTLGVKYLCVMLRHFAASNNFMYEALCHLSLFSPTLNYPFILPVATQETRYMWNH